MALDDPNDGPPGWSFFTFADFPPSSASAQVEFGASSRRGTQQPVNTDHFLIIRLGRSQETLMTSLPPHVIPSRFDEYGYAMIVADGLGKSGESASRLALATLMQLVLYFGKWNLRVDDQTAQEIMERVERFYRHVDVAVAYEQKDRRESVLQTTMTAAFGAGHDLFFAHVGHSRAYLFRDGQLMQLTHDQTLDWRRKAPLPVAPLVDVNAAARDLKHVLTDTIGMGGVVGPTIDLERFQLDDKDVVLVCTNGLTDVVDQEALIEVLASSRSPQDQSRTLVDLAMDRGGEDDATALVALHRIRK
jgi:protein phosphatase